MSEDEQEKRESSGPWFPFLTGQVALGGHIPFPLLQLPRTALLVSSLARWTAHANPSEEKQKSKGRLSNKGKRAAAVFSRLLWRQR